MATVAANQYNEEMSAGRAINLAFTTIARNLGVTLGLALIVGGIPGILVTFLSTQLSDDAVNAMGPAFWAVTSMSILAGMVISSMTQAFLTRAAVAQSEGRKASIAESARVGLTMFLPLTALALLTSIGITAGFLLLIVPGMMLMAAWAVATPAMVEERLGIIAAIERSNELTRGSRVRIFALMVAVGVITWLAAASTEYLAGVDEAEASAAFNNIGYLLASILVGTFTSLLSGTVQAAIYVELRHVKDGPASSQLEQIFS